jgi:hypothetical protein
MAQDKEVEKEMKIEDAADGSAVIDLPDDIQSPDAQASSQDDDDDSSNNDDNGGSDENLADHADDTEAIREAKRAKRRARKEYHKQVQSEKDMRLSLLQRQNQELLERLSVVERKTQGSEMARLNKAIEDQEARILFAKQKIKEATETGNGELLTSAQEMWFEARRDYESLENLKKQSVAPQQKQTIQAPDPIVQRYASEFMRNNDWYDANGRDPDSKIALTIDQALSEEGWDPKTSEYWDELENRLQRYLPHRYTNDTSENRSPRSRPRNVVTSSGRESAASAGGRNTFTLSPDQVRAMKDAGLWDDPDKRARMIKRYAQEARQQRN